MKKIKRLRILTQWVWVDGEKVRAELYSTENSTRKKINEIIELLDKFNYELLK